MVDAQHIAALLRNKLRTLFLEELLSDEGWEAYVNLLLANISYADSDYLRVDGFPAQFALNHYVFVNGVNAPTSTSQEYLNDTFTPVFDKTGVVGFQYSPKSTNKLDFAPVDVVPINIERVEIVDHVSGETTEWVAGAGPEFMTFDPLNTTTFYVKRSLLTSAAPEFGLEPYNMPEQLDPVAIAEGIYDKKAYMQLFGAPTSPQALFGMLARIIRGYDLRVWYEFSGSSGMQRYSYQEYVKFHDLTVHEQNGTTDSYITMWTDSAVPLDALRDEFGYGEQISKIIGYDKQYLVVKSNAPRKVITPLIAEDPIVLQEKLEVSKSELTFGQRGASSRVRVTVGSEAKFDIRPLVNKIEIPDFVLVAHDNDGGTFYLADPASILELPVYGITKFYSMLSILEGGILKKIHLEVKSLSDVPRELGDVLDGVLNNAAKPGVVGDLAFFFPSNEDDIIIGDTYLADSYFAASTDELAFTQRGGEETIYILMRPSNLDWDVHER